MPRIYVVTNHFPDDDKKRLIRANNQSQAIRHCVQADYACRPATTEDVVQLLGLGIKVENISRQREVDDE